MSSVKFSIKIKKKSYKYLFLFQSKVMAIKANKFHNSEQRRKHDRVVDRYRQLDMTKVSRAFCFR